jgi:hypothetical protein
MNESGISDALYEKNAQTFIEVTRRIQEALGRIANEPKLKATQDVLAQLADCSRGTLNNRQWPLQLLREIKVARNAPKLPTTDESAATNKVESRIERYKMQLQNSREELLIWKSRHDDANERLADALSINRVLQARLKAAEEDIANLRRNSASKVVEFSSKLPK